MNLTLQIHEKQIAVQCSMPVQKSTFCFALLNTLKISRFLNNGLPVAPAAAEECQMEFRPPMTKYTFDGLETGELWVEYEGSLSGWFLYMQENVIHFSSYNGWYPAGFDAEKIYDVTLKCDDSWQLVHGSYDAENTCWHYHAQDQSIEDCNILLYKPQACEQMENQTYAFCASIRNPAALPVRFLRAIRIYAASIISCTGARWIPSSRSSFCPNRKVPMGRISAMV